LRQLPIKFDPRAGSVLPRYIVEWFSDIAGAPDGASDICNVYPRGIRSHARPLMFYHGNSDVLFTI